ncbi:competence protein CoiA family protein [Propionivibrio sp.]|uniref:competence protein CoiA family protein n=1 Tax=Propionivibrio sp. TaxID=2212460 RepID=UPI0025E878D6|nr:competence protein CoiA family protein [Propionivibrio sp.]
MTVALLLPFAKRLSDGLLVTPEEVPRGLACKCICPGCENPVQARQGTEKVWHFAHTKAEACAGAYEISVHELAKQLIRERKELLLPALEVVVSARGASGENLIEQEVVFESRFVRLDDCKVGQRLDEITPDISGSRKGRRILVEVTVFHRLMPEKRQRLIDTGLASFEIDLGIFKTRQASRDLVEEAVFRQAGNRRWIYHPRMTDVEAALRARLEKRLEESRIAWEQTEDKRKAQEAEWLKNREALAVRGDIIPSQFRIHSPIRETALQPVSEIGWKASFPAPERWQPARKAFCVRHALPVTQVDDVMNNISKRSHLATTNPVELSTQWSEALGVSSLEIIRYFREAGYTQDYDVDL